MKRIEKFRKYFIERTLKYHLHIFVWNRVKIYKMYSIISVFHKVSNRKIVFSNFGGNGYGGDPKYITEYIINHNLDYEMVWLVDKYICSNLESFPACVKVVEKYSIEALHELSTAHFWIDNCRKIIYPPKKKNQVYIQTWHGTFPTKFIEKDAEETLELSYVKVAKKDSKITDYILSGCRIKTKIYQESFYYDGVVLETGTPKEDIFFDKNYICRSREKVKNVLGISNNCKVILYAPTFRKDMKIDVYDMDYTCVINAFSDKLHSDFKLLVRFHPNIVERTRKMEFPDGVINVTEYPDMQELLCAADIIISDYSSTLDYSIFDKPVFLYCPDLVEYQSYDRNFYIKLEDLPFPLAVSNKEMINNIYIFDQEKYVENLRETYKKYGLCEDGRACERVIQLIESLC